MPHVSSKQLHSAQLVRLDKQLFAAFANTNTHKRKQLYGELLTKTERVMLAKRLEILYLISKGVSTYKISTTLHVSPSTVARFENAVMRGDFKDSIRWIGKQHTSLQLLNLLLELATVPFAVQQRRIYRRKDVQ